MATLDQLASQIRFQLEQLSERNAHHDFEQLCRYLARSRICSNILPATGPVSSFGDQGRDFETLRTYLHESPIDSSSFVGLTSNGPIAFACTLTNEKGIEAKIKSDIDIIMESGTPVIDIHYFCTTDVPVGIRHKKIQAWAKIKYDVLVEIHDGQAISEYLIDQDIFWIAVRFLNIPAEFYPTVSTEEEVQWYSDLVRVWKNAEHPPKSYADFADIKAAIRRATFKDTAKRDLPFWIEQLELLIGNTPYSELKRKGVYEISVASLRGLGSMIGYEERLYKYFNDVPTLSTPSDLEDAVNLWNYCCGAVYNNASQVIIDDLVKWRKSIVDKVEFELQAATQSGKRCLLLQIRGFLYLIPELNQEHNISTDATINSWMELISLVDKAPLFPLEDFADKLIQIIKLAEYFSLIADNPKFDILTQQIDEKLAKRHGGFIAAEKCRDRAIAYYDQGKLIRAIKEIHKAKIKWFAKETLRGSILSMLFVSDCYLEMKLAFAAKYYALTAAYFALNSDDDTVRNPVKSHTLTGAWRTVGREKTLVKDIVHHVCDMVRFPRNFL